MVKNNSLFSVKFLSLLVLIMASTIVQAKPSLTLSDGYARATFPMAKSAALYFNIHNDSEHPVTLTGVSVESRIANDAQIHTTQMVEDMMRMREVTEGVPIGPNETVSFAPGGYHVMLMGLERGLAEGNTVALTLSFDHAEPITVTLPVKGMKAVKEMSEQHQHHE